MKTNTKKSAKKYSYFSKLAGAFAIAAALMGGVVSAGGYVTIGTDPTAEYEDFHSAWNIGGNSATYTLHGGEYVASGSALTPGYADMNMTIQSDSGTFRSIDMATANRFIQSNENVKLTLDNIKFIYGKTTEGSGGAIFAGDVDSGDGGLIDISGTSVFSKNAAWGAGGAIYAETINISGASTFSDNSAEGSGGAIHAGVLTLSGNNTFTGNTAKNSNGGAIYANEVIFNVGNYTFTGNTANGNPGLGSPGQGGAICAAGVTFQGDGAPMSAKLSGNTMTTSAGSVRNDIYTYGS